MLVYKLLKKAGVLMSRACNVVFARLMCLWGIAWLTYMPNVAAWKMLKVFDKMPSWNVVTWTAMMLGHVRCGQGHKALELF